MGYAYVYRCKLCRKKVQMFVGCGMLRPDVCKIKSDIQAGLYGPEAIDFLKRYPDADASAVWAVHQCRCGNTQNKYHVILKAEGTPDFVCSLRCKMCIRDRTKPGPQHHRDAGAKIRRCKSRGRLALQRR